MTLIQLVLNSIPIYTMQSALLPLGVCTKIDKAVRNFIWGSSQDKKGIPLLRWQKIILSKENGGLGIKKMRNMNVALMAKLGWRLLAKKDSRGVR